MSNLQKRTLQKLTAELQTIEHNTETLTKLINLIENPSNKTLNRTKIDLALAKSIKHCNMTNAKIINLMCLLIYSPEDKAKSEGQVYKDLLEIMTNNKENK